MASVTFTTPSAPTADMGGYDRRQPLSLLLSFLSCIFQIVAGLTILDDTSVELRYSNSGPSWWLATWRNGSGRLVGGRSSIHDNTPYMFTWHEVRGHNASVSLTFTGTRVTLNATVCDTIYNTVVDFFIDDEYRGRFERYATKPDEGRDVALCDPTFEYVMADFGGLAPAQHTFRAASVGDSLFVVDALGYDASDAVPISSSSVASSSVSSSLISSRPRTSSSTSASTVSSSTTQLTTSVMQGGAQSFGPPMDVSASDSWILYSPPGAWGQYHSDGRASSCLEGVMSSSTINSSLTYNFTGSAIQVYTISGTTGGSYAISIDSVDQGTYSSYDPSADVSTCSSRPLYSTNNLANTQHTLILTVKDPPGSTQDTVQFVGFRIPSSNIVSSPSSGMSTAGPNTGVIIGGVVGGLAGLILLVFVVICWIRRQRRLKEEDMRDKMPHPLQVSSSNDAFGSSSGSDAYAYGEEDMVTQLSSSGYSQTPLMAQRHTSTASYIAPPPPTHGDDDGESRERLTYYTLPSYHENVMRQAVARNLSEADVDAISRRLREVMRRHTEQNDEDANDPGAIMPPRELIDHSVEQKLQPRATT